MKIKKIIRIAICSNVLILCVMALLPVLLIDPDTHLLQSFIDYLNKE